MFDLIFFDGNDNVFELEPGHFLTDELPDPPTLVAAATVSVVMVDKDGGVIQASTSMPAVAGQSGNYRLTFKDTLDLSSYGVVTLQVTADNGADALGYWERTAQVETRN